MLTGIDHVVLAVPRLADGIAACTRLGFRVRPGGAHVGRASENAVAFHGESYLELLGLREGAPVSRAPPRR